MQKYWKCIEYKRIKKYYTILSRVMCNDGMFIVSKPQWVCFAIKRNSRDLQKTNWQNDFIFLNSDTLPQSIKCLIFYHNTNDYRCNKYIFHILGQH